MTDYIGGIVRRVIDKGTFEMNINYREKHNIEEYAVTETIKLANVYSSPLDGQGSKLDFSDLKRKLWNKFVTLRVVGRDEDNRVIAYISYLSLESKEGKKDAGRNDTGSG